MEFKDSRTFANLMSAFAGESQARVKYLAYGDRARKDGYQQIGDIFEETSANEQAHATLWLEYIYGGELKDTLSNLQDGSDGEHFEWSEMYKEYAEVAREEGYSKIAASFELVAKIEKEHEERYNTLIDLVESQKVFKRDEPKRWICRYCGHIHEGDQAPKLCPLCKKDQGFFEIKAENY